jgi:SAM-dependent methyltransferase
VWPKRLPEFTQEEKRIRDAFMARWLDVLPRRAALIERFNHGYPLQSGSSDGRTLEIGAGLGAHLEYENLEAQDYYALELRQELASELQSKHPRVTALVADCQDRLPFDNRFFDRVLAIHVLEHLPNLPAALDEISRVLALDGCFSAVIPCEGGMMYSLARRVSAKRLFEREFGRDYDWYIRSEHINLPWEILMALHEKFVVKDSRYYPFRVRSVNSNLVIGLTMHLRDKG